MPPPITTARLLLRPFAMDDAAAAFAALEGHPDVWKYDPGIQRTLEQRTAIIARYAATNEEDGCGTLAIVLRETEELLGYVGLQHYILPREPFATPEVELYYKLGRPYWQQGFATEACTALLDFAFDRLRLARVVTITLNTNTSSIRLLQRRGMRLESAPPSWPHKLTATLEHPQLRHTAADAEPESTAFS